jgi:iron complex transport system substrate-binding protein
MHTIAQTLQSLREVGKALGCTPRAEELVRGIEETRARVTARAAGRPPLRVLFVYDFEPLVVAGPGSFADELLRDVGAKNAAAKADTPYPVYPLEAAIAAKADVIIDSDHDPHGAEKFRGLKGLKDARWIRLPSEDLMHPGPNLGRGLETLARMLYPEAPQN